jgi:condensin complex subunit 3
MFDKELKEIDPRQYLDDELRDLYQRIGVDVPEEGEDGEIRPRSRGNRRTKKIEDEGEDGDEEGQEEEEEDGEDVEEEEQEMVQEEQAVDVAEAEEPPEENLYVHSEFISNTLTLPLYLEILIIMQNKR